MEEIELNYVSRSTGELIVVTAEFDYITGCACDDASGDEHAHVTSVVINSTVDELGNNVLLDNWEEADIALELAAKIEEVLECCDTYLPHEVAV